MKAKKNNWQKLKTLKAEEKKQHRAEVQTIVNETKSNYNLKLYHYKAAKKLHWYDYIAILLVTLALNGGAFLIGIFGFKNIAKTQWVIVAFLALAMVAWLVIGWYKNKNAAIHFNDSRKRYQTTLTPEEAKCKKAQKYLLLLSLLLIISSIIVWTTTAK